MINLMDLRKQNSAIKEEFFVKIEEIFETSQFILGKNVKEFEEEIAIYHNVKYAIGVGNGTDALVIALKAVGVLPGDEVIVPAMSFFATSEAVVQVGAIPIFVDIDENTYTLDSSKIEVAINEKTKAIIPVHIYGNVANMPKIMEIANKYKLKIIEDSCQAIGAEINGKKASSFGDAACISFFPTKNLGGAGDGGIILTNDESVAKVSKALRVHGSGENGQYAYEFQNNGTASIDKAYNLFADTKYNNSVVGYNSRLDEIQAAFLKIKLQYLDTWNQRRRDIALIYENNIKNNKVKKPKVMNNVLPVYYVYTLLVEDRDEFIIHLKNCGVGTGIYFPIPLHKQTAHNNLESYEQEFSIADYVANTNVAIPIYPELTNTEVHKIVKAVNSFKEED
jgi:dTDP-4-amino-4,6-dideoxygalactose transaminase